MLLLLRLLRPRMQRRLGRRAALAAWGVQQRLEQLAVEGAHLVQGLLHHMQRGGGPGNAREGKRGREGWVRAAQPANARAGRRALCQTPRTPTTAITLRCVSGRTSAPTHLSASANAITQCPHASWRCRASRAFPGWEAASALSSPRSGGRTWEGEGTGGAHWWASGGGVARQGGRQQQVVQGLHHPPPRAATWGGWGRCAALLP